MGGGDTDKYMCVDTLHNNTLPVWYITLQQICLERTYAVIHHTYDTTLLQHATTHASVLFLFFLFFLLFLLLVLRGPSGARRRPSAAR